MDYEIKRLSIKEIRDITGLSQKQFAEKYHIGLRSIQNWEQDLRSCPEGMLYLLQRIVTEVDYRDSKR